MSDHDPKQDGPPGVSEEAVQFEAATEDRWAIARARYAEHVRTGAGTMSVEEVGKLLRSEIARRRAELSGPKKA